MDGLVMIVQNQFKLDPFDKALFYNVYFMI
ncbi:hypothetical protein ACIR03_06110 [Clostridium cochlearium]